MRRKICGARSQDTFFWRRQIARDKLPENLGSQESPPRHSDVEPEPHKMRSLGTPRRGWRRPSWSFRAPGIDHRQPPRASLPRTTTCWRTQRWQWGTGTNESGGGIGSGGRAECLSAQHHLERTLAGFQPTIVPLDHGRLRLRLPGSWSRGGGGSAAGIGRGAG